MAIVFGSVTPAQGDVVELTVHLGCTKEVSSYEVLLANWDKKYSPSGTYPILEDTDGSISLGRGANCPLLISLRVEKVTYPSKANEHYCRVQGRCYGEKLFRSRVTKSYENKKGEYIVKDIIDNYVGLSHNRSGVELIEDTSTTYTKLEYQDTPVFDILKYVASTADLSGVIGFDFRVAPDGKFEFFPRNTKTSSVSLTDVIEGSEYGKDIFRKKTKVTIYGAADKPNDGSRDFGTDMADPSKHAYIDQTSSSGQKNLYVDITTPFTVGDKVFILNYPYAEENEVESIVADENLVCKNNLAYTYVGGGVCVIPGWFPATNSTVSVESTVKIVGSRSVKVVTGPGAPGSAAYYSSTGMPNAALHPDVRFYVRTDTEASGYIMLYDSSWRGAFRAFGHLDADTKFHFFKLSCGPNSLDGWQVDSGFDWTQIKCTEIGVYAGSCTFYVDGLYFGGRRYSYTITASSGVIREHVDTDEELQSDGDCERRAKALYNFLKDPAEGSPIHSTVIDYGTTPILPADKIHVVLPNENVGKDFRIESGVKYHYEAKVGDLEIDFSVGREPNLLADYMFAVSSKADHLSRNKGGRNFPR